MLFVKLILIWRLDRMTFLELFNFNKKTFLENNVKVFQKQHEYGQ